MTDLKSVTPKSAPSHGCPLCFFVGWVKRNTHSFFLPEWSGIVLNPCCARQHGERSRICNQEEKVFTFQRHCRAQWLYLQICCAYLWKDMIQKGFNFLLFEVFRNIKKWVIHQQCNISLGNDERHVDIFLRNTWSHRKSRNTCFVGTRKRKTQRAGHL